MRVKKGTTLPYAYTIKDADGDVVNLTNVASIVMTGTKYDATTPAISGSCTIVDAVNGEITYAWGSGETDTVGMYRIEFALTYTDGKIEKVPTNGEEWLLILGSNT